MLPENESSFSPERLHQPTDASQAVDGALTALRLLESMPVGFLEGSLGDNLYDNLTRAQTYLEYPKPTDYSEEAKDYYNALIPSLALDKDKNVIADEQQARRVVASSLRLTNEVISGVLDATLDRTALEVDNTILRRYKLAQNILTHVSASYKSGRGLDEYYKKYRALRPVPDNPWGY